MSMELTKGSLNQIIRVPTIPKYLIASKAGTFPQKEKGFKKQQPLKNGKKYIISIEYIIHNIN